MTIKRKITGLQICFWLATVFIFIVFIFFDYYANQTHKKTDILHGVSYYSLKINELSFETVLHRGEERIFEQWNQAYIRLSEYVGLAQGSFTDSAKDKFFLVNAEREMSRLKFLHNDLINSYKDELFYRLTALPSVVDQTEAQKQLQMYAQNQNRLSSSLLSTTGSLVNRSLELEYDYMHGFFLVQETLSWVLYAFLASFALLFFLCLW